MKTKCRKALSAALAFALVCGLFAFAPFSAGAGGGAYPIISAGFNHTMAVDADGGLWAWGRNNDGQLGDGTANNSTEPERIESKVKFAQVSAGYGHTMAIDGDGGLWAWGWNTYGQLGDGTTNNSTEPVQIASGTKFAQVSAGGIHTVALDKDGNLWAWGSNDCGQLGDGTTKSKTEPKQIDTQTKFTQVSAGGAHTVAIDSDGRLWTWGYNEFGQLGDGSNTDKSAPAQMRARIKFTQVSAGRDYTMALESGGRLWAWGNNYYGQLGDGSTTDKNTPVQIASGTKFAQVSAGGLHTLATDDGGGLWAWGNNYYGQLGEGSNTDKSAPTQIKAGTKFAQISAGGSHTLATDSEGNLWVWGYNEYGQLGEGTAKDKKDPVKINAAVNPATAAFDKISGGDITLTLSSNGYTLQAIKNGSYTLPGSKDFTVSGGTVTLKAAYLQKLAEGAHTITFEFSGGANPTLGLVVTDTTPAPEPDPTDTPDPEPEPEPEDTTDPTEPDSEPAEPKPPKPFPFADVREREWYYEDVKTAYESGLINGKSDTAFAPDDNLTYAEAVKLAACMHQLYTTGKVTLVPGAGSDWHSTYVSYAKTNGIIAKDYAWNTPATRAGYMEIFASALPDDALAAINVVPSGKIPDVPASHAQASAIYKLYRAGVVQGVDTVTRACNPDSNIKRSEVAAILTRMMNPAERVEFSM